MLSLLVSAEESNPMYLKTVIIDFGMSRISKNDGDSIQMTGPWDNDKYI